MLLAYRVTAGQESIVADMLYEKAKKTTKEGRNPIDALLVSARLKGYLIVETHNATEAKQLITNVPHVKSVLSNEIPFEEIKGMLESKPQKIVLNKGDIIEVTSGPFKGERAKVSHVNEDKEEITVELIEVAVPIPVTIKLNAVKIIPQ
ncbi:transcription elongation factor Spt5 [Candidatus Micrarchaeota archaeon CG_4_10_14_0_2_um_filter_55_9]|nr:MAG: transcription elongation factor Spt5 [Candidatus Micrarchaeota archaeon CG1_02_55_41]PIO02545.1 MAG: transcription elongation factor Spt5 [Candidatus Micrarchaeota archaeon CG09_land_8_20_14_0_10_55_25]PIZ91927.1 MAG: transcription elongation factor Spt5 [Candidatus Micrarchaeota archaeon CG_4_10_14_0_2_um_filter_55_9]PJD01619.1 MAG: transcription elongation factor Spt5 [Candidatus Micrarchaeota archaeon CG10_big_fil_rev_8_21_14_0_10_54_18]